MKIKVLIYSLNICLLLNLSSCQESLSLQKKFGCKTSYKLTNTETVKDFKKNFSIKIPKNWKTKLYFDSTQSEIFTADTLKYSDEAYIINLGMVYNNITIDDDFKENLQQTTSAARLTTISTDYADFKKYKGIYHIGKGQKNNLALKVFQWYILIDEANYLRIKVEIYGEQQQDRRLCEALNIIKSVKVLKP